MKNSTKLVGFLSAPGWLDPAPEELRILTDGKISVQQTIVGPANFDWHTKSIAEIGPYLKHSAMQLAAAGCTLIASPATPFGYIGHRDINQARLSNHHLQENIGILIKKVLTIAFAVTHNYLNQMLSLMLDVVGRVFLFLKIKI